MIGTARRYILTWSVKVWHWRSLVRVGASALNCSVVHAVKDWYGRSLVSVAATDSNCAAVELAIEELPCWRSLVRVGASALNCSVGHAVKDKVSQHALESKRKNPQTKSNIVLLGCGFLGCFSMDFQCFLIFGRP